MSAEEAQEYHALQTGTFAETSADMIGAFTLTNANEAIGITRATQAAEIPVAISFTLETDGRLPTGQDLCDAITEVDAATGKGPVYYMINCTHPTHFCAVLASGGTWVGRVRGLRSNASKRSHQELNDAAELDDGDPLELGEQHRQIIRDHPHITVLGGCCGTDHRHVACISLAASPG